MYFWYKYLNETGYVNANMSIIVQHGIYYRYNWSIKRGRHVSLQLFIKDTQ